jgi:dienelactone hydrolase
MAAFVWIIEGRIPTRLCYLAVALCLWATTVNAELRGQVVEYQQGEAMLEGYLVYEDSFHGTRPGVRVFHEWTGLQPFEKERADRLARLGYAAFAADVYGKGVRAKDREEAARLSGIYKSDRKLMRARAAAALDVLKSQKRVDATRLAAVGYCFGGTVALELARSRADLEGVVTFHAGLDTPTPAGARHIKGKVLVLHGADDPSVPPERVAAFQREMREGGVDWQMVFYGGAVRRFTNPSAGTDKASGAAYNERADRRSWQAMKDFLAEVL